MTTRRAAAFLIGLALLLGSFQNCALHQSESRKLFEKMLAQNHVEFCLPYLSNSAAVLIFDTTEPLTTSWKTDISGTPCLITLNQPMDGSDTMVCYRQVQAKAWVDEAINQPSLPPVPLQDLYPSPAAYSLFEVRSGTDAIGSGFTIQGLGASEKYSVQSAAAVPHSENGIRCISTFDSQQDFEASKDKAANRTRYISEEMARNL